MEDLKPCPFCGGKAVYIFHQDKLDNLLYVGVMCKTPSCVANGLRAVHLSGKTAADRWNRRAKS